MNGSCTWRHRTCGLAGGIALLACGIVAAQAPDVAGINPMRLRPDHVTASVADLDTEESWYERVLGFHEDVRHNRGPDFEVRHLSLGTYHIDLAWQKGSVRQKEVDYFRQGWMHVVFNTPVIDAAYRRLMKFGTDVRAERNAKGLIWRIFVHDPEGNQIEIVASQGETRSGPDPGEAAGDLLPPPIPATVLPPGENRALFIRTCTVCHTAEYVVARRRTAADWDDTVTRMIVRGAVANDPEKRLILDYLDQYFGQ
jgi:catechol 2,3-dioxygenase-like lactoylglutathione lyase family enzyme